ncbi:MAG TPA: hypothetical protein VNN08_08595 [Thermoanaerobaculia bacterium]|nr:hypothetical protein [Thermoanaerobaculia bacterium]
MSKRALLLAALVLCASCQKLVEGQRQFHDFMALQGQIAAQFNEKNVYVNYSTGAVVTVQFINSPLLPASDEEKQTRADDVAVFVADHCKYPVSKVSTFFIARSASTGVSVSMSNMFVGHLPKR